MRRLLFTLMLMSCMTPVIAEDFSIGEPFFTVTEDLLAHGRASAIAHAQELLHNPGDVIIGNPDGKVTLVQFLDFECPLSEKMDPAVQELIEANPDLRVIYKPYPIHGKMSDDAAEAALAAYAQNPDKYLNYHVALMKLRGDLPVAKILAAASQSGLNAETIKTAIATAKYAAQIDRVKKLAKAIGVPGTPALFIMKSHLTSQSKNSDVVFILGSDSYDDFQTIVNNLLK